MQGDPLPPADIITRYCRPGTIQQNGLPSADAFLPRPADDCLSVNWLEHLNAPSLNQAMEAVRAAFVGKKFDLKSRGRFVNLRVDEITQAVQLANQIALHVLHWPEDNDPSHSGIFGYTNVDLAVGLAISSLVSADKVHPALA